MPAGERDREQEAPESALVAVAATTVPEPGDAGRGHEQGEAEQEEPSFFEDPGQITKTLLIVAVLVAAIYVVLPKIAGLDDAVAKLGDARRSWLLVAVVATLSRRRSPSLRIDSGGALKELRMESPRPALLPGV